MYINKLIYENVGPIERVKIIPSFTADGNPKPILLVGENGSGKSTILSNIVDAFYEIAGQAYDNACYSDGGTGHEYYKAIRSQDILTGKAYMFSYIQFQESSSKYTYFYKGGNISPTDIPTKIDDVLPSTISFSKTEHYKGVSTTKEQAEHIFKNNVLCFFGPDRYEKPAWLVNKYYESDIPTRLMVHQRWSGQLANEITVKNVTTSNLQWLLDVIVDSRADIVVVSDKLQLAHILPGTLLQLMSARDRLETIMSKILGEDIYFSLNFRNTWGSRFRILRKKDNTVVTSSLDALSTGQLALFNTFATIIRYADTNNMNQSIRFSDITGIVVIDEVELHLHTKLQKEVLPKLIKLFPNVQFIISTHAPLFLLGMNEAFGESGFDIYELPTANKITAERFSEFQKAFDYFQQTQRYQSALTEAIKHASQEKKVLVITEGPTDWKHMKAAYCTLRNSGQYSELFDGLDFDFLEYESIKSSEDAQYKLEMGNNALEELCQNYSKLPQTTKYIFIADRDVEKINKKFMTPGENFKSWGNNVFSFIIPLPKSREQTPSICIEHLYSDEEIKTEYKDPTTGISRRLYIGNEFDERGLAPYIDRFCEKKSVCGTNSVAIIEGSSGERVTSISKDSTINYALSKSKFASLVLAKEPPFDDFNFTNFVPIFEVIKQITEIEKG